jgi:Tol biopolymer transport system component
MPDMYGFASWSPDGKVIAATALDISRDQLIVVEIPAEGGEERPVSSKTWPVPLGQDIANPVAEDIAWLPDGRGLVLTASEGGSVSSNQLWLLSYPDGGSRRITNDLNAYLSVSLTGDGRTVASVQQETSFGLWTVSLEDPARPRRVTSGTRRDDAVGIAWTPDGRIVHGVRSTSGVDLWIRDADGGNPRQLTRDGGLNVRPWVSPDGRHVFFSSNRSGDVNIWRIDIDGGNPTRMTDGEGEWHPCVSPDGRWLVYGRTESGFIDGMWRMPVKGGPGEKIVEELVLGSPVVSPDGTQVAFGFAVFTDDTGEEKTGIVPFVPDATPTHVFDITPYGEGNNVRWSADGRALIYVESREGVSDIWSQPVEGGAPRRLTNFGADAGRIRQIALSPDGETLLFDRGRTTSDVVLLTGFR